MSLEFKNLRFWLKSDKGRKEAHYTLKIATVIATSARIDLVLLLSGGLWYSFEEFAHTVKTALSHQKSVVYKALNVIMPSVEN